MGRPLPGLSIEEDTKKLYNDLREELQKHPRLLAEIFPESLKKITKKELSNFGGKGDQYVYGMMHKIKKGIWTEINEEFLTNLQTYIENTYGSFGDECLEIIHNYRNGEIEPLEFIDKILESVSKISGTIELTDRQLGIILVGSERFISYVNEHFAESSRGEKVYNPEYQYSLEKLGQFKEYLTDLLGDEVDTCLQIIQNYIDRNSDLKEYSKQQYTVENPKVFSEMSDKNNFYALGMMYADGSLSKYGLISLELARDDIEVVRFMADVFGYDKDRIHTRVRMRQFGDQEIRAYRSNIIGFACKPMEQDLKKLGYLKYKSYEMGLPDIIKDTISEAKRKAERAPRWDWKDTVEGKLALSFLAGFFDGDGSYRGDLTARIFDTNKEFLDEIKEYFEIPNEPRISNRAEDSETRNRDLWVLHLSPEIFQAMCEAFDSPMGRKRPTNS